MTHVERNTAVSVERATTGTYELDTDLVMSGWMTHPQKVIVRLWRVTQTGEKFDDGSTSATEHRHLVKSWTLSVSEQGGGNER